MGLFGGGGGGVSDAQKQLTKQQIAAGERARAEELRRQRDIESGLARINAIFDGGTYGVDPVAAGTPFDPSRVLFRPDGSRFIFNDPATGMPVPGQMDKTKPDTMVGIDSGPTHPGYTTFGGGGGFGSDPPGTIYGGGHLGMPTTPVPGGGVTGYGFSRDGSYGATKPEAFAGRSLGGAFEDTALGAGGRRGGARTGPAAPPTAPDTVAGPARGGRGGGSGGRVGPTAPDTVSRPTGGAERRVPDSRVGLPGPSGGGGGGAPSYQVGFPTAPAGGGPDLGSIFGGARPVKSFEDAMATVRGGGRGGAPGAQVGLPGPAAQPPAPFGGLPSYGVGLPAYGGGGGGGGVPGYTTFGAAPGVAPASPLSSTPSSGVSGGGAAPAYATMGGGRDGPVSPDYVYATDPGMSGEVQRINEERRGAALAANEERNARLAQEALDAEYERILLEEGLFGGFEESGGFGDEFFDTRRQASLDFYLPELERQYSDAQRAQKFALANSGQLQSSTTGNVMGNLVNQYGTNEGIIRNNAENDVNELRRQIEAQRQSLINQLFATGDADAVANIAANQVRNLQLSTPSFNPLGQLFNVAAVGAGNYLSGQQQQRMYGPGGFAFGGSPSGATTTVG